MSRDSFTGRHVRLVPPRPEHFPALRAMLNDPPTMQWLAFMSRGPAGWSLADVEERYREHEERGRRGEGLSLVITDPSGAVAGSCGFNRIEKGAADFGIILHRSRWGAAMARETHLLMLDHAFGELRLTHVDFVTLGANVRMRALLEGLEIPLEDDIDTALEDGTPVPGHRYRLTVSGWPAARARLEERLSRFPAP